MPTRQLGKLFDQDDLRFATELVDALQDDVGEGSYSLPEIAHDSESASLVLFDQPLRANGTFKARLALLGAGAEVDAFGTGRKAVLRSVANPAELVVETAFGINGEGSVPAAGLSLSAKAATAGSLTYRHWYPSQNQTRFNALALAVSRSRLPQLVGLAQGDDGFLLAGEVHRLEGKLSVDFGLTFEVGRSAEEELSLELFGGLPTSLSVAGEATIKAALGLSMLAEMQLSVGRAHQLNPGWIRVRLQRAQERRLSFGACFALQLHYDLGSGLVAILEETLDRHPVPDLVESLREINDLLAEGDWDSLRQGLSEKAGERLTELLDGSGWRQWLATSPEVGQLTALSARIVDAYDRLDPRVQSWWDRLLGKAELDADGSARRLLQRVAGLDADLALDDLLGSLLQGAARDALDLLETFTGESVESLLAEAPERIRGAVREAATLAQSALGFIDDLGADALREVHGFLERTGVERVVELLGQYTSSKETLEAQVTGSIRRMVERLVGKAWGEIRDSDLVRVRAWAERMRSVLSAPEKLEARLKSSLEKLKLDYGVSISLELERVSRSSALLDLELDPAQAHAKLQRSVAKALRSGDAKRVLQVLSEEASRDEYDESPLPFQLRECVFTSDRLRTSAFSAFLEIFGLGKKFVESLKGVNRRVEQSSLRVAQGANGEFVRTAEYSAAFERSESENKAISTAGVWLSCREQGAGLDIEAPYDTGLAEKFLRLTYSREDEATSDAERTAIDHALRDLGFSEDPTMGAPAPAIPSLAGGLTRAVASAVLPLESKSRFSFEIHLPAEAIGVITQAAPGGAEGRWNTAFLNAAHRWLMDQSVFRLPIKPTESSVGPVLAQYIRSPLFQGSWTSGSVSFRQVAQEADPVTVTVRGGSVAIKVTDAAGAAPVWRQPFGLLEPVINKRKRGLKAMGGLAAAWEQAEGRDPGAYEELLSAFSTAWRRTSVFAVNWPTPLFGVWFAVARLTLESPAFLSRATGVASLHWKSEEQEDWNPPVYWRLEKGIPNNVARGVFPFS